MADSFELRINHLQAAYNALDQQLNAAYESSKLNGESFINAVIFEFEERKAKLAKEIKTLTDLDNAGKEFK
jgi:hypothetical protein